MINRKLLRIGGGLAVFLIVWMVSYFFIPSSNQKKILVKIPRGSNSGDISRILGESEVITNSYLFLAMVKVLNCENELKAGVYEFTSPTPVSVLEKLRKGEVKLYKITIPEGLPKWEVAELLSQKGIVEKEAFLAAINNPQQFYDNSPWLKAESSQNSADNIDSLHSLEGYLFPDTYYFPLGKTSVEVVGRFLSKFEKITLPLYREEVEGGFSLHQIITLASIVEKEAKVESEKPIIAGVFYNRLKMGMKLRADPTVKYALGGFDVKLSQDLLVYPSVYNTYLYPGLPPSPICSPGLESIRAAVSPAKVNYLYFVARGDGTHEFSCTYQEHLKAIRKYQRG